MDFNVQNTTAGLIGLGVVVLIALLVVAWYYLKNIFFGISSLSQNTKVFSDSAKSLSLDMKSLTMSLSALSQDIKNQAQVSGDLSQDIKALTQDAHILSQNVDNLSNAVNGLISSQTKMTDTMATVEKMQDDAAKSIERVSKHFAE